MKYVSIIVAIALAMTVALACPPADKAPATPKIELKNDTKTASPKTTKFVPKLAKGYRFVLEVTKGRTQSGRPGSGNIKGFQIVDVEILGKSGKNILLSWTTRKTMAIDGDGKPIAMPPQAAALAGLFDGVQMIFELSPEYEMIGLKNFDQIKIVMGKVVDKTLPLMKRSANDEAKLRQTITTMFNSRETVELICSRQIGLFLGLSQLELDGDLEKGAGGAIECQMPMPYGGGLIPAILAMEVTKLDTKAKQATVTITTKMDPEKTAQAMLATMRTLSKKMGKPAPAAKDLPKVDIKDLRTYVIDLKTNLPLSTEHSRTAVIGTNKRTDTLKIILKPAGATTQPADK